jgi:hypothetical protein
LLEAATDLTERIHDDFADSPGATTVLTPVSEVLRVRDRQAGRRVVASEGPRPAI